MTNQDCNFNSCSTYKKNLEELANKPEPFNEETAVKMARQCLVSVHCDDCDLCRLFCPDLCITRNLKTGEIEVDYNYCKGCGICAFICPKNAIDMARE